MFKLLKPIAKLASFLYVVQFSSRLMQQHSDKKSFCWEVFEKSLKINDFENPFILSDFDDLLDKPICNSWVAETVDRALLSSVDPS